MEGFDDGRGDDEGRAAFQAEQSRAQEDEALAGREEQPEPLRPLERRERVALWEMRGSLEVTNLGTIVRVSPTGYIHVEWDDHTEGWFSPAKAAARLRRAEGDHALPRHVWIFDVPEREAADWKAPLPTLDEPVCAVCRAKQTDDNEYGPCKKEPDAV